MRRRLESHPIKLLYRAKQSAKVLFNLRRRPRPHSLEEQVYAEIVRDGDVCFDIGANVGWIALFLARTAGVTGKVFAFVDEGQGNETVAHQRAIEVGDMIGNDYVVLDGIRPGDKVIVSGVQMLAEGMPVSVSN